jgi:hypothetical protein
MKVFPELYFSRENPVIEMTRSIRLVKTFGEMISAKVGHNPCKKNPLGQVLADTIYS